jgi:hypothetical protein
MTLHHLIFVLHHTICITNALSHNIDSPMHLTLSKSVDVQYHLECALMTLSLSVVSIDLC